ncbi:MAG: Ig-like domain-containing protein, partial [Spirochaetaceae bacterium]
PVDGTANWEHTIDVSDLDPGMYNILVRARDAAGNEGIGGPYNIFVDPESDLPLVNVLYPQPLQRSTEELFVVGTATDNERVDSVEVQINDGRFVRAEGAEFWSARIPVGTLEDGEHTVTVRAVDNNGLAGVPESVRFRIDTAAPTLELTSHEGGFFVTRPTTVEGTIDDANGVTSLVLDRDGEREEFRLRGRDPHTFSFRIDPRELAQGAQVWNLVAEDATGRSGTTPLLFFVDTEAPDIDVLYPTESDRIDAQFRAAGRVSDAVGVDSLSYSLSTGQSGEIPLTPGDPFWTLAVDLEPGARGRLTADFTVRDVAGNEHTERLRMPLDPDGDEPRVHRLTPSEGALTEQPVFAGHVSDDDGVVALEYSVNGGESIQVPVSQSFLVPLAELDPGRHEITYYAIDRHGVRGSENRVRFTVATPLPDLQLDRIVVGEQDSAYEAGFTLEAREQASITGFVDGTVSGRLNVTIGDRSSTESIADDGSFSISLPRSNEPGLVDYTIQWVNELERTVEISGFYAQLPPDDEEQAGSRTEVERQRDARVASDWDRRVPGVALPEIAVPGELVDGRFEEIDEFDVAVEDSLDITQVRSRVVIGETEGSWVVGTVADPDSPGVYTLEPVLPEDSGRAYLEVEATNATGTRASIQVPFIVDRLVPEFALVSPTDDDVINGRNTVVAVANDLQGIHAIEARDPGSSEWVELSVDRLLTRQISATDIENDVVFRVTTHAGLVSEQRFELNTDEAADVPELILQVPENGQAVRDELRVSGVVLDDDRPEEIEVAISGSEPVRIQTDGLFDFSRDLSDYPDGEYSVSFTGYDIGGTPSDTITRRIVISRSEPVVELARPAIDDFSSGTVRLDGTADDPNGIESVWVSLDSGASFRRAEGTEEWSINVDSSLLDDATHSLLVRAYDTAGDAGILATIINVDNAKPGIELSSPVDGEQAGATLIVDGRIADCNIQSIRIILQHVDSESLPEVLTEFRECGPFVYAIDTRTMEPGRYALLVEADDLAGNVNYASRTVTVPEVDEVPGPTIVLPEDGSSHAGSVQGLALAPPDSGPLTLHVDGRPAEVLEVDSRGRSSFVLNSDQLADGEVSLSLHADATGDETVISFAGNGPSISIDSPAFLDYVRDRPFLTGTADYRVELPEGDDRQTRREREDILSRHEVVRVEVSRDNGESWEQAQGTEDWRYRIETTELTDGRLNLVVRASFADGSVVTRRHSVTIDEQPPVVRLIAPGERERFSNEITVVGATGDDNMLADVAVALRAGDKSRYEVPAFIQGLYLDASVLGATYWDAGAGLTFFDDNVRIQGQVGLSPPGRFSGLVLGTKLIANVAQIPASFFLGPDYEWLSAAVALGANFSYYTMSEDTIEFTDEGLVLAGMLGQLEFPIVRVPEWRMFNTYSLYTEAQLWFISSDVEAGTAFRMGFGLRTNVF